MVFAFMRSAAKGYLRPFRDDTSIRVPVTWYEAPEGAAFFPLEHRFQWDQWPLEDEDVHYPAFEREYSWYSGQDVWGLAGQSYCGSAEQWQLGPLTSDPVPAIDPDTGSFICCGPSALPDLEGSGGLIVAGLGIVSGDATSTGGVVVTGDSTLSEVDFSSGGVKCTGISQTGVQIILSAGGVVITGSSTLTETDYIIGGVVLTGENNLGEDILSQGGIVITGSGVVLDTDLSTGLVVVTGSSQLLEPIQSSGTIQVGCPGTPNPGCGGHIT